MKVAFFYESDPTSLDEQITKFLDKNKDISVFKILQTTLPPERVLANFEKLYHNERIECEAYLVVSIWYQDNPPNMSIPNNSMCYFRKMVHLLLRGVKNE